jgi:DNA-binding CsgD family transcriptional regulator
VLSPDVHSLIGRIYDAALNPSLWDDVLLQITNSVGGSVGVLILNYDGVPGYVLMRQNAQGNETGDAATFSARRTLAKYTRFPPEILEYYINHFFLEKDIWYQKIRDHCRPGSVVTGSAMISEDELRQTSFYQEILKPSDAGYLLGGLLAMDAQMNTGIAISRPLGGKDFGAEEKSLLGLLLPHMIRAWQLQSHFGTGLHQATQSSMEQVGTAMILIGKDCEIIYVNRAAESILRQQDGLLQKNARLAVRSAAEHNKLNQALRQSAATAQRKGGYAGQAIQVTRPSGRKAYQLLVSPLNLYCEQGILPLRAAVCVFIHDPERYERLSSGLLQDLYRLTRSECRVAQLFYQGMTLVETADRLGISVNTVRTHLYRIMEKTGTHTQAALMKLLAVGAIMFPELQPD